MKVLRITVLTCAALLCGSFLAYAQEKVPKDFTVTLERTSCYGWCPAYKLTILADGTVQFSPVGAFAQRGDGPMPSLPLTGKITTGQLAKLLSDIKRINFFSLKKHYVVDETSKRRSNCPEWSSDSPTVFITIVAKGMQKTVSHYLGCEGTKTLSDLVKFEDGIDKIAGTDQWTSQFGWNVGSVVDLFLSANELAGSSSNNQISINTVATDPENDVLTYNYIVSGGKIIGSGARVIWDLTNIPIGTYTITAGVDDGCGVCGKTVTKTVIIK